MNDPTAPARHWQQLLAPFGSVLTQPGYARSAPRATGTALGWEEHTVTQVLTGMGLSGMATDDPSYTYTLRPFHSHRFSTPASSARPVRTARSAKNLSGSRLRAGQYTPV